MAQPKIRVAIVDDEALAREGLKELIRPIEGVEIVAECGDGVEAIDAILSLHPDLVFLDVQMPGLDGFGVLSEIGPERMPGVIFVTAYDEFAVRAFEVRALDYLLKPLDPERFRTAFDRAVLNIERDSGAALRRNLGDLLTESALAGRRREYLAVRTNAKTIILKTGEIDWIEAEGDYVVIHSLGKKHLVRGRISDLESRLDPARFVRIHRSSIVNLDRVKELEPLFSGEYSLSLKDGSKLTVSRSYRENLFAHFVRPA